MAVYYSLKKLVREFERMSAQVAEQDDVTRDASRQVERLVKIAQEFEPLEWREKVVRKVRGSLRARLAALHVAEGRTSGQRNFYATVIGQLDVQLAG